MKDKNLGKLLANVVITALTIAIAAVLIALIVAVVATVFKGMFWYLTFLFC